MLVQIKNLNSEMKFEMFKGVRVYFEQFALKMFIIRAKRD